MDRSSFIIEEADDPTFICHVCEGPGRVSKGPHLRRQCLEFALSEIKRLKALVGGGEDDVQSGVRKEVQETGPESEA